MNDHIIQTIDAQIAALQQARAILVGTNIKRGPGRPRATVPPQFAVAGERTPKRKKMSADARSRIAAAQKARWAKLKKKAAK